MYLRKLRIRNVGPIPSLDVDLPFSTDGKPKPLVLVGGNGSGKSLALAFLANAILESQQTVFERSAEVETGRVYKLRSSGYIRAGARYYSMHADFDHDLQFAEWQLDCSREQFEKSIAPDMLATLRNEFGWAQIEQRSPSGVASTFAQRKPELNEAWVNQAMLYFPADRHETPAWLNEDDLRYRPRYDLAPKVDGRTTRRFVRSVALKDVIDWLLDVVLDARMLEPTLTFNPPPPTPFISPFTVAPQLVRAAPELPIERDVISLLAAIIGAPAASKGLLTLGSRHERHIGRTFFDTNGKRVKSNSLLSLSSGEAQVFTMFASILRDYDKTGAVYQSMGDVRGIVLVDEIDLHLHTKLQRHVLPKLIKQFPMVQFVLTTHSPLFVLGLERELGVDAFELLQMPEGIKIHPEQFAEFDAAFEAVRETEACRTWAEQLQLDGKPLVVTEGKTDAALITIAWRKLYPNTDMPFRVTTPGADGAGGATLLSKALQQFPLWPSRLVAIFDRDHSGCENHKGLKMFLVNQNDPDVRKRPDKEHWAIVLPVPKDRGQFRHQHCGQPAAWHIEIEHYFPTQLLVRHGLVKQVPEAQAGRPFELNDGPKASFAAAASGFDPADFHSFRLLFDKLRDVGFLPIPAQPSQWGQS